MLPGGVSELGKNAFCVDFLVDSRQKQSMFLGNYRFACFWIGGYSDGVANRGELSKFFGSWPEGLYGRFFGCYNAGSDPNPYTRGADHASFGHFGQSATRGKHRFRDQYGFGRVADEGLETEFVSLADRPIQPCLACGRCMKSETVQCLQEDPAFEGMLEKFSAADGILIGSPVYFGSATPQMMALLDRVGYVARRHPQILRRKVGAAIVVARRAGQNFTFAQLNYFFLISRDDRARVELLERGLRPGEGRSRGRHRRHGDRQDPGPQYGVADEEAGRLVLIARNFKRLEAKMRPQTRARANARAQEIIAEMLLSQIRQAAGMTQEELAASLGIKQPTLSRIESQDDIQVSTLQRLVRALGGELEIIAHLPGRDVRIGQFKESA